MNKTSNFNIIIGIISAFLVGANIHWMAESWLSLAIVICSGGSAICTLLSVAIDWAMERDGNKTSAKDALS